MMKDKGLIVPVAIISGAVIISIALLFFREPIVNTFSLMATQQPPATTFLQQVPLQPATQYSQYWVNLVINPSTICAGLSAQGIITSNIPNGICSIYVDLGTGFQLYRNIALNANGGYTESQTINTPGMATFRAICCDSQMNCRVSSDAILVVNTCPGPTPPTDSDGDGFSDQDELNQGTNPFDPNDYPGGDYQNGEDICDDLCEFGGRQVNSFADCLGGEYPIGIDSIICCCQNPPPGELDWYCCDSYGYKMCEYGVCSPMSFVDSGPYNTLSECEESCQQDKSCDEWVIEIKGAGYDGFCGSMSGSYCYDWQGKIGSPLGNAEADAWCGNKCCYYSDPCNSKCAGIWYSGTGYHDRTHSCDPTTKYFASIDCCCGFDGHHGCEYECHNAGYSYLFCFHQDMPGLCTSNGGFHLPVGDAPYGCQEIQLDCCCR